MNRHFYFILWMGLILNPLIGFSQKTISIESLLKEMVDRDERAKYPAPAFTCRQFSSYARETVSKDRPGWFANRDHSNFLREENNNGRREQVMMEAEGPGAIVRFWMTLGTKDNQYGVLRIYIDDYTSPAIEGSVFEILSGTKVTSPPLAASVSELMPIERRGHNLYFPIPYARRCKITYESEYLNLIGSSGTEAVFYNINYRTYEPATKVISYSAQEMKKNKPLLESVLLQLKNKDRGIQKMKLNRISLNTTLQPNESKSFTIQGMYAIRQLSMDIKAADQNQALRSTVLEIAFDGEKTVWAPVGDFYGTGYKPLYTATWYTQVEKEGLRSAFWVMPFQKECVITLHNLGKQDVTVTNASAGYSRWKWDHRSMHFGAGWRQHTHILGGPEEMAQDIHFANLQGKGVYVGDGMTLFDTVDTWWGEGDEKIFVDGESFPSHIGTGTEDYYGYAWSRPEKFTDHPFIAQPTGGTYWVNTRYRALDGIPFNKSIYMDMELWFLYTSRKVNYAPVVFWYMLPGGQNLTPDDVAGVKEPVALHRSDIYSNEMKLSVEGEDLRPLANISTHIQGYVKDLWSNDVQLVWLGIGKGQKTDFEFTSPIAGIYDFTALLTIAPDYGVFNLYLNGRKIASDLDLFNPVIKIKKITFEKVNLQMGQNIFSVELTALPKERNSGSFGIDKLIFSK